MGFAAIVLGFGLVAIAVFTGLNIVAEEIGRIADALEKENK